MEDSLQHDPREEKKKKVKPGPEDIPVSIPASILDSLSGVGLEIVESILGNVSTLIHVTDINTREILFINSCGIDILGDVRGRKCWAVLHEGQTGPCPDCINRHILDKNGNPAGVHVWEHFNTANNRWYDCRATAMRLSDGRLIAIKAAMDITGQKEASQEQARYAKRLERVRDMSNAILADTAPRGIARKALKHIKDLVPGEQTSVFSFGLDARTCTILAVEGDAKTVFAEGSILDLDDVLAPEDLMEGHVTIKQDLFAAGTDSGIEKTLLQEGFNSYLRVPLWIDNRLTGSLNICSRQSHFFTDEHVEIAREVATTLALAIRQAQLRQKVEDHTRELEKKIEERTMELELLNRTLTDDISERREVVEQLRESEERYRTAIESSNDGVAIIRGDKVVFTNRKYIEIFGYDDPREILGKEMSLTIHPDDAAWVMERNARRQQGESVPSKYECRGSRKDGTTIYVEASATSINYRGEAATLAYIRDVTQRKEAEEKLRESERQYRFLIENAPFPMVITSLHDDRIVFINQRTSDTFRFPREEAIGQSTSDFYDDPAERIQVIKELEKNGKLKDRLVCLKNRNGERFQVLLSSILIRFMGEDVTYAFLNDVTEQKRAEEALRASEKQYRDLVESSLVGIYQTDVDGRILYINDAFAKMLGFDSPDEVRREKAFRYYADPQVREAFLKSLKKEKRIPSIELELLTKSAEKKSVLLSATLEGRTLSGMAKDITERKRAEQELKEKSQGIEEANAALKALLKQRERDRDEMEQKILVNFKQLIFPYLDKLRSNQVSERQKTYLDVIESNIRDIISPFIQKMTAVNLDFTPTEIKVAAFIRDGKTVKEISGILGVSESAVNLHRQHIRNKLSLNGKKISLRTFLMSLK